ncbi:MAG: methylmalonyl-CoA epimerase [Bacteroidales bacterium]|nr:methylmalonyl-CoA epimerase [Bacteroidales bacterium]
MKTAFIEHIGIAVENLDRAIEFYTNLLGTECYKIEEVEDQKVKTAFFMVGQTKIELLATTDPEGPVGRFIAKKGEGIHHIAFAVDDITGRLVDAAASGINLIDTSPRKGADGLNIAFLHPRSTGGVLIELCEPQK